MRKFVLFAVMAASLAAGAASLIARLTCAAVWSTGFEKSGT